MSRRFFVILLASAIVPSAAVLPARAAGELPRPLLELTFNTGLANTGSADATLAAVSYAPDEGPLLQPGPWGDCLDLTAASRFGGTGYQTEPAGGALECRCPALDKAREFTLTFWMRPATDEPGLNARVLTKVGSWEVMYSRGVVSLYVTEAAGKRTYPARHARNGAPAEWLFVGVGVDPARGRVTLVRAPLSAGKLVVTTHKLTTPLLTPSSPLQIGNLEGLRPFKGRLDSLRVYAGSLSREQLRRRFELDRAAVRGLPGVYSTTAVPPPPRRFQFPATAIPFSTRWQRRRRPGQPDVFSLLSTYHATHLLWVYGTSARFIREVHGLGLFYQGTLNGMQGWDQATSDPNAEDDATGRQWDLDGNKFVLPHMDTWKGPRYWTGCHNNPAFRRLFQQAADRLAAVGVDGIQIDDWTMSLSSACRGQGCYCPWCMKMFRRYLKERLPPGELRSLGIDKIDSFDYRTFLKISLHVEDTAQCRRRFSELFRQEPLVRLFVQAQRASLRRFYQDLRRHLDKVSPARYLPVSVNNQFFRRAVDGRYVGAFCTDTLDFFIGETTRSMQTATHFIHACKLAEGFGIPQVMMCKPRRLATAQAALATTYALGAWMRVPWDVYMDNDPETHQPAPRYFGTPADWKPFYDFIHAHPDLFTGYQSAATVGLLVNGDEDTFGPLWDVERRLSGAGIQFRVFVATSQFSRIPLSASALRKVRWLVEVSPDMSFSPEDRDTLAAVRDSLRVRFLSADAGLARYLTGAGAQLVRVEGPPGVYPFLRVKPGAAVVHLVNWNTDASGRQAAGFNQVTLELRHPRRWGNDLTVRYWRPGRSEPLSLMPEHHPLMIRLTVPRLTTWGVVEVRPGSP